MPDHMIQLPDGCPPLRSYYMYLTGGCNLACQHCWLAPAYQPNGGTGGHLPFELFELAIEEGLPLGLKNVKLTGGEPTLHPDFERMVKYINARELGLTIETNGILLTQHLAELIKDNIYIGYVSVSVDGADPATHDAFRGVQGSFERAWQGVRHLVTAGMHPQIIMSLHVHNVDQMEALVRMAEDAGASSVKFNIIQPSGRGELMTKREQVLTLERLIEIGRWIEDDLQSRAKIPLHFSWPLAFYGLKRLQRMRSYSCGVHGILGVLYTGELAMCGIGLQVPDLIYGQLGKDRLVDVWTENPQLQVQREQLPRDLTGICANCIFQMRCKGYCPAENYFTGGSITAPHWFCEMADATQQFPDSRRVHPRQEPLIAAASTH